MEVDVRAKAVPACMVAWQMHLACGLKYNTSTFTDTHSVDSIYVPWRLGPGFLGPLTLLCETGISFSEQESLSFTMATPAPTTRIRRYQDVLTTTLHRRFLNAAGLSLGVCYVETFIIGEKSSCTFPARMFPLHSGVLNPN